MPALWGAALLLLAVAPCTSAARVSPSQPTRHLQQSGDVNMPSSVDCDRSVKHCNSCRYQFFRGTVTKAICSSCTPGYVPRATGRACYCAPGYYSNASTSVSGSVGFECQPCGDGAYCPGARITAVSSTVRTPCGLFKLTTTQYAKSDLECMVQPGYGWGPGDTSTKCALGFFNPGYNTRKCTPCAGGLTTPAEGSTAAQQCLAPSGYYYLRGKAVACARSTYKAALGNFDCTSCPEGVTTPFNTVAANASSACSVLLPGYEMAPGFVVGETAAAECPQDTYRSSEYDLSGGPLLCTPCGLGTVTLPNVTAAKTPDACLAPPGYGWLSNATNAAGSAVMCPPGTYNPGWNREACVPCGGGTLSTPGPGATSADQCFTPAGHGNFRDPAAGSLVGFVCPNNTFGRRTDTYGLVDVECTKCLEHLHTDGPSSTSPSQCVTDAGYGYGDGQVSQCDYGYWSPGGSQAPCSYCGDYHNTTAPGAGAAPAAGAPGATSSAQCAADFGFTADGGGGLKPCVRGYFKDTLGLAACTQCPNGTTTTLTLAATQRSDCDACRPGFGSPRIDLLAPRCEICPSGTYSPGYTSGGQACVQCPKPSSGIFTGHMVSRRGASTPEACLGEFSSDGTMHSFEAWDVIPMGGLAAYANDTVADCHASCAAEPACMYYEFRSYASPGVRCWLKLSTAPLTKVDVVAAGPGAGTYVLLAVSDASYVAYPAADAADADAYGVTLSAGYAGLQDALGACGSQAACIGLTFGTQWRTFGGRQWQGAVGRVRAVGEAIDPWLPEPSAAPT